MAGSSCPPLEKKIFFCVLTTLYNKNTWRKTHKEFVVALDAQSCGNEHKEQQRILKKHIIFTSSFFNILFLLRYRDCTVVTWRYQPKKSCSGHGDTAQEKAAGIWRKFFFQNNCAITSPIYIGLFGHLKSAFILSSTPPMLVAFSGVASFSLSSPTASQSKTEGRRVWMEEEEEQRKKDGGGGKRWGINPHPPLSLPCSPAPALARQFSCPQISFFSHPRRWGWSSIRKQVRFTARGLCETWKKNMLLCILLE